MDNLQRQKQMAQMQQMGAQQQNMGQSQMSPEEMSEQEMMMMQEEDMNQRLMAVVGILATALDKYMNTKVDYISCYNKLADATGDEPMNASEKLEECIHWKNSMIAQAMELLGAEMEGEDQMTGESMMEYEEEY